MAFYDPKDYVHRDQWYRTHRKIRDYYEEILLSDRTIQRGYFNKPAVAALLKRQREGGNSFTVLSTLLTFELYLRLYLDK